MLLRMLFCLAIVLAFSTTMLPARAFAEAPQVRVMSFNIR